MLSPKVTTDVVPILQQISDNSARNQQQMTESSAAGFGIKVPAQMVGTRTNNGGRLTRNTEQIKLWAFLRGIDQPKDNPENPNKHATGRAEFSMGYAIATLRRSESTIRRLLRQCLAKGFIRHWHSKNGVVVVYYSSLSNVAIACGMESLGAIARVPINEISSISITATEIVTESLQRQSRFAAKKAQQEKGKRDRRPVAEVAKLFPSGQISGEALGGSSRYYFANESFVPFGASQFGIAARRGVRTRTVQRHLSNRDRAQYNERITRANGRRQLKAVERGKTLYFTANPLPAIAKKQLAIQQPERTKEVVKAMRMSHNRAFTHELPRFFVRRGRLYYVSCNLYLFDHELLSSRFARKQFNSVSTNTDDRRGATSSVNEDVFLLNQNAVSGTEIVY